MFGDQKKQVQFFIIILIHLTISSIYHCHTSPSVNSNLWQKSELFQYSRFQRVDIKRSAYHESGHILVAHLLNLKIAFQSGV